MTEASLRALDGLRDLTMLKWFIIPLLAIVFYIYAREIKEARFEFYAAIIFVLGLKKRSRQILAVAAIYAMPILMNISARAGWGWNY